MVQLNSRVLTRTFRDRRSSLYEQPVCRVEPSTCRHLREAVIDIRILPVPSSVICVEHCDCSQGKSGSDEVACGPPCSALQCAGQPSVPRRWSFSAVVLGKSRYAVKFIARLPTVCLLFRENPS